MSEASTEMGLSQDDNAANAEAKLTPFRTLIGVIVRPRATFEKLRDAKRGYWWLVFTLAAVATILLAIATSAAQASMFQNFVPPEGAEMPANFAQTASTLALVGGIVGGVISTLVGYFFLTLIVFGSGLILGGKATFKQVFTMSVWTTLPYVVRTLVQAAASLVTGALPAPGLSGMLTTAETLSMPVLAALLTRIDVYTLWSLVLLAIGVGVVYRLSRGKTLIIVAIYVAISLGLVLASTAALSGIQNMFSGGGAGGPGGRGPRL
jgi:hypothetical protein